MASDPKDTAAALKKRALGFLARREYTRRELTRRLAADTGDSAEIERVMDELEARGWLSESRVAEQLIHARRSRFGARKIERDLRDKGVSDEGVAAVSAQLKAGELDAARAVWQRKFGHQPRNGAERARQVRFLQGRGFEFEVIFKVIKQGDDQGPETGD